MDNDYNFNFDHPQSEEEPGNTGAQQPREPQEHPQEPPQGSRSPNYQYPYTFYQNYREPDGAAPGQNGSNPDPRSGSRNPNGAPPPAGYREPAGARPPRQSQPPRKKKSGLGWRVAVIAAACGLGGCLIGGAAVGGVNYLLMSRNPSLQEPAPAPQEDPIVVPPATGSNTPVVNTEPQEGYLSPTQVYAQNVNAVVGIANESASYNIFGQKTESASSGSGFIITGSGEILTNYHVVEGAQRLTVTLYDGTQYAATVVGYEKSSDVALLKIKGENLPHVTIGNSDDLLVGDEIAAIGNPLGELTYSMTVGHVSSKDRDVNTDGTPINMMQIDAAINSGNSGGPLFNMYGQVVGITTAKYSGTTNSGTSIEGIGFAIPINDVISILEELRTSGTVPNRAAIGVVVSDSETEVKGAQIQSVQKGSSGEMAGLRSGDIITAVDGSPILNRQDLVHVVRSHRAGDEVTLTVHRGGEDLEVKIIFGSVEDMDPQTQEIPQEIPEETEEGGFEFPWDFFPHG